MDSAGKAIHYAITPLMVEFKPRDLMQVIVGASILAVPVAFTEETWKLGEKLPLRNVLALSGISNSSSALRLLQFLQVDVPQQHPELRQEGACNLLVFGLRVGVLLTLIQQCPWGVDNVLAIKRILIVSFPASMSAAISDTIK